MANKTVLYQVEAWVKVDDVVNPDPGVPYPDNTPTPHAAWKKRAAVAAFVACIPTLFFTNTVGNADFPEVTDQGGKASVEAPAVVFDKPRNQYMYPSWQAQDESHLGDAKFVSDAEKVAAKSHHPDFVFDKSRLQYTYPAMQVIDTAQMTQAEDNGVPRLSKWLGYHPDIIFDKDRRQYLYPAQETEVKFTQTSSSSACTAYRPPTAVPVSLDAGGATDFTAVFASDDTRAAFNNVNDDAKYGSFGDFGIPDNATIDGIKVRVEGLLVGAGINHSVDFALLNTSGGIGIYFAGSNSTFSPTDTAADEIQNLGGATNDWGVSSGGRTWQKSDFANGVFRVDVSMSSLSATSVDIDYFEVSVCYTEITPSWERPPETITADKWNTHLDDKVFDKKRTQYSYPYFWIDPSHLGDAAVLRDLNYQPSYPDIIFDKPRTQYTYPWTFPSPDTTFNEFVSRDRVIPQYPDFIFDKARNQFTYPTLFIDPSHLGDGERITPDKWLGYHPDIVFDKQRNQYLYPFVSYNINPIGQPADTQLPAIFQTPVPLFDKVRMQYAYPTMMPVDAYQLTQEEFLAVNWIPQYPDFVFDVKRQQYTYPNMMPIDMAHIGDAEIITVDKWNKLTPDIVFDKKRLQYLYPTYVSNIDPTILPAEDITLDKYAPIIPVKVWDKKRNQYTYPYFWIDGKHLLDAERTDVEPKWYPVYPAKVYDIKRQQYTYTFFWIDADALTGIIGDDMAAAWAQKRPDIVFDRARTQYTYPHLFYYDGLVIEPCPPHTDWGASGQPQSTDWAQAAPVTTDWSKSNPPNTQFSESAPNNTQWTKPNPDGTDWDESC